MLKNTLPGVSSSTQSPKSLAPTISKSHDSVHVLKHEFEFEIPLLYWRLKTCPEGTEICRSPLMSAPTNPPMNWQFKLHKQKTTSHGSRYLYSSANFILASTKTETCAGTLELFDRTEKRLCSVGFRGIFKTNTCAGTISISDDILLSSLGKNVEENDLFILRCKLEVLQVGSYNPSPGITFTKEQSLKFDWKSLWKTMEIDDVVTLKLANCEYRAHKSFLSAGSPVFAAMFKQDAKEKNTGLVSIEDIDEPTLEILLEFIYSNMTSAKDLNEENAAAVLAAAEKYMLLGLKELCEDLLIKNISCETFVEYLKLADMFSCTRLKSEALSFLSSELALKTASPGVWEHLFKSNFVSLVDDVTSELEACNKISKDT